MTVCTYKSLENVTYFKVENLYQTTKVNQKSEEIEFEILAVHLEKSLRYLGNCVTSPNPRNCSIGFILEILANALFNGLTHTPMRANSSLFPSPSTRLCIYKILARRVH